MSKVTCLFSAFLLALQIGGAQPNRIAGSLDETHRVTLRGHLHPRALAASDQGRVAASQPMSYVTVELGQTPAQQADLAQLLAAQQNPASPNYRRWLTPEQYAQRFGVSDSDLSQIQAWLEGHGLSVAGVARGRNWIAVNGTAAQVENTFQTEIHQYVANGVTNFANATEPSVPAALSGLVQSVRGLHNYRLKPAIRRRLGPAASFHPENTAGRNTHYLAPGDFATIYDIMPVYASGITGTGQKLAVAGQTQISISDITQFRSTYGLPANNPTPLLVPGSQNPGVSSTDVPEADLDLEWSGAVAQNASILFVYSYDVMTAVQYVIDQNLAPVLSSSYGSCELETPTSDVDAFQSWAKQGSAQGITWVAASGDDGAADCDDTENPGLAVDVPGSIPEVTSVGGTTFVDATGTYWSTTNTSAGASALSYIPETAWNDSTEVSMPASSGGGTSILFAKPSWQTGTGVPSDNSRHVPDIAFAASPEHDGYLVVTGGTTEVFGGTSAPTPSFAGMLSLMNQYLISTGSLTTAGLGTVNPELYSLAQSSPSAFHDVTTGNNIVTVPCSARTRTCNDAAVGYNAGAGYDQVTGWGSVDFAKLAAAWSGAVLTSPPPANSTISLISNASSVSITGVVDLIATVTGVNSVTPTGTVDFSVEGSLLGAINLTGSGGVATATLAMKSAELPSGGGTIAASYETDSGIR